MASKHPSVRSPELRVGRRDILAWPLAALLGAGCQPALLAPHATGDRARTSASRKARGPRVVVIGGGLTGLAAAHSLGKMHAEVVVLEAQARVGGRILTVRSPFHEGLYIEAGAAHVVGDPDLMALCDELDVTVERTPRAKGGALVELRNGKRRTLGKDEEPTEELQLSDEEKKLHWEGRMKHYFAPIVGTDPKEAGWSSHDLRRFDNLTIHSYLDEMHASPAFLEDIVDSFCPGASAETASALATMREVANLLVERTYQRGGRIAGGTDRLPEALRKALGDRVILNADVRKVTQTAEQVSVEYVRSGKPETIVADFVISTVPTTVLDRIAFHPPLSAEKRAVIAELAMASVARVYVESKSRFWNAHGEAGVAFTDLPIGKIRNETDLFENEAGILGSYLKGDEARRFAAIAEPRRLASMVGEYAKVFPEIATNYTTGFAKVWDEDPYERGAYAWFKPNQLTEALPKLVEPAGRIHFAGDQTSHRPGFMHGALASAKRVVVEIGARVEG